MDNQDRFNKLFKEFEEETKKKTNNKYNRIELYIDELREKGYNPYVREYTFIDFCRRLRNINSHNVNDNYFLVTDDTIKKFEKVLYEVKHPFKVLDKATSKIYDKSINDNVIDTMKDMSKYNYTHIPIYEDGKLVGIFSENSIFQYILEEKQPKVDNNTTFNDVKEYINVDKSSDMVIFVSKDKLYDEVVNEFISKFSNGMKLSCIMVTEHGLKTEKVIGILTAWDIIGR